MPVTRELFGARTGNCLRTAIALEEAGLAYTPRPLNFFRGEHRTPAHLALNPRGRVPVLVVAQDGVEAGEEAGDEEGADLVLTQSNAIQLWADAQAPGVLLPRDGAARARVLDRWLFVVTDVIGLNFAAFRLMRAEISEEAAAPLQAEATSALAGAELFLDRSPWLAGDAFTLADIAAYPIAVHFEDALDWPRLPRLRRWYDQVGERPAVRRGMAAFG